MSGQIPEELIDDLRHRVDIVEVIGEHVNLKKRGQNYVGLCPFHSEKTPSFVVSPQKQIYHCFGCGKGGNIFSFLMEKDGLAFPEVVSLLAERYGVILPKQEVSPAKAKQESLRKHYYHINELASGYYQQQLHKPEAREPLEYLKKRGLRQDELEKFLLGYTPPGWDHLSRFLLKKGVKEKELILLGLAVKTKKGNIIDRFRNRIIFPIADDRGRVVGFGGRVMDDTQPKYLNSPDTPLYNKSKHLYALNHAKGSIRTNDQAIIMEGYMDVITAHQNGIDNAVGALGTALALQQALLLMRYTYNILVCFDADAAGQKAALRGMDLLQQQGCQVAVITIPEGKDPDEYIKEKGKERFTGLVGKAQSLLEYKLIKALESHSIDTVAGKIKIVQSLVPDIQRIQSPVTRQVFIQMIAERLNLPEPAIYAEVRKGALTRSGERKYEKTVSEEKGTTGAPKNAAEKAQRLLIRLAITYTETVDKIESWGGETLFGSKLLKEIYRAHYLIRQSGHNIKANDLVSLLEDRKSQELLTEILLEDEVPKDWKKIFVDCLTLLKIEHINKQIMEYSDLMSQYEKSGEASKSLEMMQKIQQLVKDKQILVQNPTKGGQSN